MLLDLNTIRAIEEAGVDFVVNVRAPGGYKTIGLEPEQVVTFVYDRDQAIADSMGVTKAQYLEWVETDGTPRCGAETAKGTRCKNFVSGGIQFDLQTWLQMDGDYCAVHGGEGSYKTKRMRAG